MEERFTTPYLFAGGGGSRMPQELYGGGRAPAPEFSGSSASPAARALYAACAPPSARGNGHGSAPGVGGGTATASSFHARPPPRNESIGELANAIGRSLAGEIAGLDTSSKNARSSPLTASGMGATSVQGMTPQPSTPAPASGRRLSAEAGSLGFLPHAAALAPALPGPAVSLRHPHSGNGELDVSSSNSNGGSCSGGSSAFVGVGTPRHHQAWAEHYNEEFRAQGRAAAAQSWVHADAVHRCALDAAAGGILRSSGQPQQHVYERSAQGVAMATTVAPSLHDASEDEGDVGSNSSNGGGGGVRFLDQSWTAVLQSAAGPDLLPFLHERESRALVLCGCGTIPTQKIRIVLEKYGRLYYLRDDFAARGAIFAGYFDLRSSAAAQANFSRDLLPLQQQQQQLEGLSARPPAAAYFSVMLHGATAHKEGTLVVRELPPHVTEGEVLAAFQAYGSVSGICKQISLQPGHPGYFYIDYFDIQDAKHAADSLRAANPWCQRIGVEPAVRGDKERMQSQQLMAMLMRWREEMHQAAAAAQHQQHAACAEYAACVSFNGSVAKGGPGCIGDGCGKGRYGDMTPATSANTTPSTTPGSTPPSGQDTYPAPVPGTVLRQQSLAVSAAPVAAATAAPTAAGCGRGNVTSPPLPQQQPLYDVHAALMSQQQKPAQRAYVNGGGRECAGNGNGNRASFLPAAACGPSIPPGYFASDVRRNSGTQPEDDVGSMFFNVGGQHGGGGGGGGVYYRSPSSSSPQPQHSQQQQQQQQHGIVLHDFSGSPPRKSASSPTGSTLFSPYAGAASKASLDRSVGGPSVAAARRESCGSGNCGGGGQPIDEFGLDFKKIGKGLDKRTTIMIRNIPNKYTQAMLLREIDANFREAYDFFYLPIDFKNKCNVGYAFINFMDFRRIVPFFREFNGQRWKNFNSEKVCAITYARIQGKASMISRFQNSSLMEKDGEYRPLLFCSSGNDKGRPEPFPIATKARRSFTPTCHASGGATSVGGSGGPGLIGSGAGMLVREGRDMSGAGIIGGGSAAARECQDRERARSSSAAPNLSF